MKILRVFRVLTLIGAGACLGTGYLTGGLLIPAGSAVLITLASLFADRARWMRGPTLSFLVFSVLSGVGIAAGMGTGWMLAGMVFDLAAWDLAGFSDQLTQIAEVQDQPGLIRRHLALLGAVALGSVTAAFLAGAADLEIRFFWMVILAGVTILVLNRLVEQLKDS